jgi:hypothetical protein
MCGNPGGHLQLTKETNLLTTYNLVSPEDNYPSAQFAQRRSLKLLTGSAYVKCGYSMSMLWRAADALISAKMICFLSRLRRSRLRRVADNSADNADLTAHLVSHKRPSANGEVNNHA